MKKVAKIVFALNVQCLKHWVVQREETKNLVTSKMKPLEGMDCSTDCAGSLHPQLLWSHPFVSALEDSLQPVALGLSTGVLAERGG